MNNSKIVWTNKEFYLNMVVAPIIAIGSIALVFYAFIVFC